jgi:hypothetical protein
MNFEFLFILSSYANVFALFFFFFFLGVWQSKSSITEARIYIDDKMPREKLETYLGTNTIKPLALIFTTLASVSVGLHEQRRIITFAFVLVWRERERERERAHGIYRFLK